MRDPLAPLLADGVIEEVLGRLKSGKEADVWRVRHAGEIVVAKVYKQRELRSFRHNAGYTEGRLVRNTRTQRAIDRGSRFGQAAAEDAWKTREADALHALFAGGVRVPKPVMFYEGVLLMELVVDADGHPAPRLIDAHVPRASAAALYRDLRRQVVAMLCCDLVHSDLSPYNVLLGHAGPVVIDFPQVVGAAHNNQAERFLRRDLENLRRFFAQRDPELGEAVGDAQEIWRAYARRELTPDFVPHPRRPGAPPSAVPVGRSEKRHAGGGQRSTARPGRHADQARREHRQAEVIRVVRAGVPATHVPHPGGHPGPSHGHAGPSGSGPPAQAGHRRRRRRRRRGGSAKT